MTFPGFPLSALRRIAASFLLLAVALVAPQARADSTNCTAITVLPKSIIAAGHYCLGSNLTWSGTSGNAISINANNVVLDCNNHSIAYVGTAIVNGIAAVGRSDIEVRNCNLSNFGRGFVFAANLGVGNRRVLIANNNVAGARSTGMTLALHDGFVIDNRIVDTIGTSAVYVTIDAGSTALINGNVIHGLSGFATATGLIIGGKGRALASENRFEGIGQAGGSGVGISVVTDSTVTPVPSILDNNHFYLFKGATNTAVTKGGTTAKSLCTNVTAGPFSASTGCL